MIDIISRRLAQMASSNSAAALAASTTTTIIPSHNGALGQGNSPAEDQAGWAATLAAIGSSRSASPIGSLGILEYQTGAMIEPGIYDAGDFTQDSGSVRLVARVPGTVIIRIPANKYFMTFGGAIQSIIIDGITFIGGKGALKSTNTNFNSNALISFTRNIFYSYTECAISNNSNDSPFARFQNNIFIGATGSSTIGIAWGGYIDQVVIEDNSFGQNTYHTALGPRLSGNFHVVRNDFISNGGTNTLADIWLKPNISDTGNTNGGFGATIEGNKFGNENQAVGSPRILIANEDTSTGTDRATYRPSTSDSGFISGLSILNNRIAGISGSGAPFIRSYVSNVRGWYWRNNKFDGGQYTYVIEWPNGRYADYTNCGSDFEFVESDGAVPAKFSTHSFCRLRDFASFWPGDLNHCAVYPASDSPALSLVASALAFGTRSLLTNSSRTASSDPSGGSDYELVTGSANNAGVYLSLGSAVSASGGPIFIELALAQAASRTVSQVMVDIFNTSNSTFALKRTINLPSNISRFNLPVQLPASAAPGNWQLRVYAPTVAAGSADSFVTGDWIVNTGGARMGKDRALSRYPLLPRNRAMLGGAGGTWPLGWTTTVANGLAGLSTTVTKSGIDSNGAFVEVSITGTTTAAGYLNFISEVGGAVQAASGQQWQYYMPVTLVAGSLANANSLTGSDGTTGLVQLSLANYNSANAWLLEPTSAFTPNSTYALYGKGNWAGFNGATSFILPKLSIGFASGQAISATLRLYTPTLRRVV